MIINSLYRYYQILSDQSDSDIPTQGFGVAKVTFAFVISAKGDLLNIIPLSEQKGKKQVSAEVQVPQQVKRSSGILPNFLCDNSTYILGIDTKGKPERSKDAFDATKTLHYAILDSVEDVGARAVLNYFTNWNPEKAEDHPVLSQVLGDVLAGGNIVFRQDGELGYIHDRPLIKAAWARFRSQTSSEVVKQCLVSGETGPIARLHPSIKGVRGAQSSGASLVSFNLNAFTSYGKTQSFNAPVSEEVTFSYTTALNYLLSRRRYRVQLDPNTTVVFWSQRSGGSAEENLMAELLWPSSDTGKSEECSVDNQTTQLIHDILNRIRNGLPLELNSPLIDPESRFAILGLSPNASRLSVRFWNEDTFGNLLKRIAMHYNDLAIVGHYREGDPQLIPASKLLLETAPLADAERIPPLLGGGLMRAMLGGQPYPDALYTAIIARIRADHKVNTARAAMLKACLIRKYRIQGQKNKEVSVTVGLNQHNTETAYTLGRLFAVLEKAQQDANPSLNATIRDRYFGAASATPKSVFPILLRLAQHHVSKAQYGYVSDKRIENIMASIKEFPAHLNLEDQGQFMLGYYHQRQAFFEKSNEKEG